MEIDYQPKNGVYDMYIHNIKDSLANCVVLDDDGQKSYMEVPMGDLEKVCTSDKQIVEPGVIFLMYVKKGGEEIDFEYVERTPISKQELNQMVQTLEKEYGDI
tara:strand:- start:114 stop:422 length:309 start_codon:yes stop_codon:yes gene_type:complete